MLPELTPEELHARLQRGENIQLVDVRQPEEYAYCRIEGSELIPLGDLARRADEVADDRPGQTRGPRWWCSGLPTGG